jgi:omega-6 fatty acid desaturase (delta-12 desaturase)
MPPLTSVPEASAAPPAPAVRSDRDLHDATLQFARGSALRSWWHVGSTFVLLVAVLAAAALAPWWPLRAALSLVGALVMVRAFILYHDFMHGALLPGSRLARAIFYGYAALHLTPPRSWRASHNFHHANVGRIRGSDTGSFELMTTEMWRRASPSERLRYRVSRHPATILCAYVTVFFFSVSLLPLVRTPRKNWDSAVSIGAHFAVLVALWGLCGFAAAFHALLLPMAVAAAIGGYLFYAQHSYPGMRILPEDEWTHYRAALASSSHLRVGPVMRWFTGNIGIHHVHHLNPLIPFYALPAAMAAIPELQTAPTTSLRPRDVVACFRASLWDAESGRMVRYRDVPLAR